MVRNQRVARLRLFPVKYHAERDALRLLRKACVRIRFELGGGVPESDASGEPRGPAEGPFDDILRQTLINYDQAKKWRMNRPARQTEVEGEEPIANEEASTAPVKVFVEEEGVYAIGYQDLAGLESLTWNLAAMDPRNLAVTNRGRDVAVLVSGEDDGRWDPGDSVQFYAVPPPERSARSNVYWLGLGTSPGLRMSEVDGTPGGTSTAASSFLWTEHFEENDRHWDLPGEEGEDRFHWKSIQMPSRGVAGREDVVVSVAHLAQVGGNCTMRVLLKGRTSIDGINPDHHTRVFVNGHEVADATWDGRVEFLHEATFPQSYLQEGDNTVTVEVAGDTGGRVDSVFLNWIEIDYRREFEAEDDILYFSAGGSGATRFQVGGFGGSDLYVFEIGDHDRVKRIVGADVTSLPGGTQLAFETSVSGLERFVAFGGGATKVPSAVEVDEASQLRSTTNEADYVIITHEDFYRPMLSLRSFRQERGFKPLVVKVDDVYDEFNHGIKSAQAIKDFLGYAYASWALPPVYVLLVGDANFDSKDYFETGKEDFVPTHLIDTLDLGDVPSDNWFGCVSGEDSLPDLIIGRISVNREEEAEQVAGKTASHEGWASGSWRKKVVLASDNDTAFFEFVSDELASIASSHDYDVQKIYLSDYPGGQTVQARTDLKNALNGGCLLTNYIGHGAVDVWANEPLLRSRDVSTLKNSDKLTFVTTLNCLNGFFHSPLDEYCIAEEFVSVEDGGAVGVFAPSALGYPSEHRILGKEFFQLAFEGGSITLVNPGEGETVSPRPRAVFTWRDTLVENTWGSVATGAKISAFGKGAPGDLIDTFVFFGDPAAVVNSGWYRLQVSSDPSFPERGTVSVDTVETSYTPQWWTWFLLRWMSMRGGTLYWRVGVAVESGDLVYTEPGAFSIGR
jgi:hypothetical protein